MTLENPLWLAIGAPLLVFLGIVAKGLIDGMSRGFEVRYQEQRKQEAIAGQASQRSQEQEQTSIELATQLLERYSTRLEQAYDRERARREASDEEVARLRVEVSTLRLVVSELNEKLAKFLGEKASVPIPILVPVPAAPSDLTPVEKREAEVGRKPVVV